MVISLLAVDQETDRYFHKWLSEGHRTGYPGIALDELGAEELDSVSVVYDPKGPVRIFVSYSHKDEAFRQQLDEALAALKRSGGIETWDDRSIEPGLSVSGEIERELSRANVMILLVSPSFMASDYCYEIEMTRALARHRERDLRIVPIIIRETDWQRSPFGDIRALPRDGKPIASWQNPDEAWLDVAKELRTLVERKDPR